MSSVRRSLVLSFAESYVSLGFQLGTVVVLSRLLTPAEVGVFAIATVFSLLASSFRDFGIGEYLIQEPQLSHEKIRAAFAVNICVSWTMGAALLLAAPLAATFYREDGVASVMRVLSLSFFLVPFGAVVQSFFRRELQYVPLVICKTLSNAVAFVVAVWLALRGHGYMSAAWANVAGMVVTVVATMYFRPPDFPRLPGTKGIRDVLNFGKYTTSGYLVAQLGRGAPDLIIGRVSGVASVGIFSRASGTIELVRGLVLRPVLQICLPYLSRARRESGTLGPSYLRSVGLVTAVGWPVLAVVALTSYAVIRVVYGTQWLDAVPLARVLCLFCAIELLYLLAREALLAAGEARSAAILEAKIVTARGVGLLLAVPFGLEGAAWGMVLSAVVGLAFSDRALHRVIDLNWGALVRTCAPSVVLTGLTAVPIAVISFIVPITEGNYLLWVVFGGLGASILWLFGLKILRHPLWDEGERALAMLRQQ